MWRPGEEIEEMGMPLVSAAVPAMNGLGECMEEDDGDWGEEEVFDHGYEDASDGDETASDVSFNSESAEMMARSGASLLYSARDLTRTPTYLPSDDHHDYDDEEDVAHSRYVKPLPTQHEPEVSSRNSRPRVHYTATTATADVSSSGTSSDVSSRGGGSVSSSSNRGVITREMPRVVDLNLSFEARGSGGVGGGGGVGGDNTRRPSSGGTSSSTCQVTKPGGVGGGGGVTAVVEGFLSNVRNGRGRSNCQLSTSSSGALPSGATSAGRGAIYAGRCGLVENFGVGGAPTGIRMCGTSAAAAADMPAGGTAGASVRGGGFINQQDRDRDYPSLSSPRMQTKWLGVVRSNNMNNNNNTKPKAIPRMNECGDVGLSKGLTLFGNKSRGGGGGGGAGGGGGGRAGMGGVGGLMTKDETNAASLPKWRQSAPVNFVHVAGDRRVGIGERRRWAYSPQSDEEEVCDNDWNNEIRIYPHELVAMNKYSHKMVAFSVADGTGGTVKGRELRRLRDLVLRQVMGYESRYPDGTPHELIKPIIPLSVMD